MTEEEIVRYGSRVQTQHVANSGGARQLDASSNMCNIQPKRVVHEGSSRQSDGSLNLSRVQTQQVVNSGGGEQSDASFGVCHVEPKRVFYDDGSIQSRDSLKLSEVQIQHVANSGGAGHLDGLSNICHIQPKRVLYDDGSRQSDGSLNLSRVQTQHVTNSGAAEQSDASLNLCHFDPKRVVYDGSSGQSDGLCKLSHLQRSNVLYVASAESDKSHFDQQWNNSNDSGTAMSVAGTSYYCDSSATSAASVMFRTGDWSSKRNKTTTYHRYTSLTSGQNVHILPAIWRDCDIVLCDSIPFDIDGLQHFRIKCNEFNFMTVSKDGRPWEKWKSSNRRDFGGIRRISNCRGQPICRSVSCIIDGMPNRFHFKYDKENIINVCKLCGNVSEMVLCFCRKVLEYSGSAVESDAVNGCLDVYHVGNHTCLARKPKASSQKIQELLARNPGATGSGAVSADLEKLFAADDVQWNQVEDLADEFVDQKQICNAKAAKKKLLQKHGVSYDAVCKFKSNADKHDKFMVYSMNNGEMNNGLPTYVFKSSKASAQLALDMDRHGNGLHNTAFAHIDCKHDRVKKMKTVTRWMHHMQMQKLMCLAVMDINCENTENLTLFWNEFNNMLQELKGDDAYSVNPAGFIVDEHPANWNSIELVFGLDAIARTHSCEFHYKQSLTKHSNKVQSSCFYLQIAGNWSINIYPGAQFWKVWEAFGLRGEHRKGILTSLHFNAMKVTFHKVRKHYFVSLDIFVTVPMA